MAAETTKQRERYLSDKDIEEEYPLTASFLRNDRCTKRHGIPYLKIGRKVRYKQSVIEHYIKQCERKEG